jgi:hypothetical protein
LWQFADLDLAKEQGDEIEIGWQGAKRDSNCSTLPLTMFTTPFDSLKRLLCDPEVLRTSDSGHLVSMVDELDMNRLVIRC